MQDLLQTAVFLIACVQCLQGAWEFPFKKNTLVVDMNSKERNALERVKIECNVSGDQAVQWSKKSHKHKTLTVTVRELADVGNYTCETRNQIVDYKVILLHQLHRPVYKRILSHAKEPIYCKVKNYSGHFICSWTAKDSALEFFFEAQRGNYSIDCDEPEREDSVYSVTCHDTQLCQYAEEELNITVVLHVIRQTKYMYENHTLSFALRDIVKPDPPQDLTIKKTKNHRHVSLHWKYPKTWCNIHSFFPLIFNINISKDNQNMLEHHHDVEGTDLVLHHKEVSGFCVQARDMYFNSSWSDWSCYKPKKESKKKSKNEKKTKKEKKKLKL